MKKLVIIIVLVIFAIHPVVSQTKEEKKAAKKETAEKQYEVMKDLINSASFTFTGEWATSQKGRRINLISNPTFIKMDAKNADAYLPFFGTAQVGGYGAGGAIEFKGEVQDYSVTFDDKKQKAIIKFKTKTNTSEILNVTIAVFGSLSANVTTTSSNRSSMSYSGKITALEQKED